MHVRLCVIDAALEVGCDISNGIAGSQSTPQRADEQADGRELLPKRVVYLLSELTPLLVGEPRDLAFQDFRQRVRGISLGNQAEPDDQAGQALAAPAPPERATPASCPHLAACRVRRGALQIFDLLRRPT